MNRSIGVSTEVYHRIWSLWRPGEPDEDAILRRVLADKASAQAIAAIGDEQMMSEVPCESEQKEESGSYLKPKFVQPVGKIRWVDDVVAAISAFGGQADLAEIYREVERIRSEAGRSVVSSLEATVRQTIHSHSSDSEYYQGRKDYFQHVDRGVWRLR